MKITIITPTFNSSKTIVDSINSLNIQSYHDIEHIVIDNLSYDNTLELIRQNARFETRIISEKDASVYEALNKGIEYSTGDVIGILHSDDTLASSDTIERIVKTFKLSESFEIIDVVYGDLVFVDREFPNKMVRKWISCPFEKGFLKRGWMPPHPTLFMRRSVYEKHGLFNTKLSCSADYDFILRVFSDDTLTFHYLPEVITKMRMGGISTKGFRQIIRKKTEDYRVLKHNRMPFPFWVLLLKSLTKIPQLMIKGKEAVLKVRN